MAFWQEKIVYRFESSLGDEIIVKKQWGQYSLTVKGVPQSGGIVEDIWKEGIKALPKSVSPDRALLLGLGGGTVVKLLKKKWPQCEITAVEIDPETAAVARTYFGLDKFPDFKAIIGDAWEVVNKKRAELGRFNLIIIDLYVGQDAPAFARSEIFFDYLTAMLEKDGLLVLNLLLNEAGRQCRDEVLKLLKRRFPRLKTLQTATNELIFAY